MTVYLADYEKMHELCLRAAEFPPVTDTDRFIVAVLTGAAAELDGDYERANDLLARSIEIATRLDDAHCLIWVSAGAGRAGNWGDGLPYARRAVRLARERALVSTLPYALEAQASQLIGQGQFDLAYASAEEGRRLALDLGQHWIATWNLTDSPRSTRCAAMSDGYARGSGDWKPNPRAARRSSEHASRERWGCSTSAAADHQKRSTNSCSRSTPSAPNRTHGSCSASLTRPRPPSALSGRTTSAATSITSNGGSSTIRTALGWRSSHAVARSSKSPTQTAITPRQLSLPTRCRRSSERAPGFSTANGYAGTAGGSTLAATYARRWQRSSNTLRRRGQTARAASCAPAARAPANATPPRETNSHLRNSTLQASLPTGSRTPRSEPSSSSARTIDYHLEGVRQARDRLTRRSRQRRARRTR